MRDTWHIFKSSFISTVQVLMENGCSTIKHQQLHKFLHIMGTTVVKWGKRALLSFWPSSRLRSLICVPSQLNPYLFPLSSPHSKMLKHLSIHFPFPLLYVKVTEVSQHFVPAAPFLTHRLRHDGNIHLSPVYVGADSMHADIWFYMLTLLASVKVLAA